MKFPKHKRWSNKKYRDAAQGQDCKMRLPGCCNETETVVLAHRNGAGVALKHSDHDAADMCFHCHSLFDAPDKWPWSEDEMMIRFNVARLDTIVNRIERGIIK